MLSEQIAIGCGFLLLSVAQFSPGDRCLVVADNVEIFRKQVAVDKLPKGQVIVVKAVQPSDGGNWIKVDRDNGDYGWIHEDNLARDGLLQVKLDDVRKAVVVKEDAPIKMAAGTTKVVEDVVRVRHAVTLADRRKVDGAAAHVFGKFEPEIRAEIEKATGRQFGAESETKRSVTIQGGSPKSVKVRWLDYYRTGTATMLVAGQEQQAPFEFKEDHGLVTEEVDALPQKLDVELRKSEPPAIAAPKPEPTVRPDAKRPEPGSDWPIAALAFIVGVVTTALAMTFRRTKKVPGPSQPPPETGPK